jgi:hypothetical protein
MGVKRDLLHQRKKKLSVFENMLLMRILTPKREEVTVHWRKLKSGEFNNLNDLSNIIRMIK